MQTDVLTETGSPSDAHDRHRRLGASERAERPTQRASSGQIAEEIPLTDILAG